MAKLKSFFSFYLAWAFWILLDHQVSIIPPPPLFERVNLAAIFDDTPMPRSLPVFFFFLFQATWPCLLDHESPPFKTAHFTIWVAFSTAWFSQVKLVYSIFFCRFNFRAGTPVTGSGFLIIFTSGFSFFLWWNWHRPCCSHSSLHWRNVTRESIFWEFR